MSVDTLLELAVKDFCCDNLWKYCVSSESGALDKVILVPDKAFAGVVASLIVFVSTLIIFRREIYNKKIITSKTIND